MRLITFGFSGPTVQEKEMAEVSCGHRQAIAVRGPFGRLREQSLKDVDGTPELALGFALSAKASRRQAELHEVVSQVGARIKPGGGALDQRLELGDRLPQRFVGLCRSCPRVPGDGPDWPSSRRGPHRRSGAAGSSLS